jgi:glycerate dehydrogenase
MVKIVILDGHTINPGDLSWSDVEKFGALTVYERTDPHDEAEIERRIASADAVLTKKTLVGRTAIRAAANLKYIGALGTGFNHVDCAAARERGIPVCNIPSYATEMVAQFALALLLEVCCHAGHHSETVHEGKWEHCADFCYWDEPLVELTGKTAGIIGFGRIGQATGRLLKAFGMKVLANNPSRNDSGRAIADYVSLDSLLALSDVIFLHCPLLPSTRGMINRASLAKMKDGVVIINNSRGPLIVEQDLADALNAGKVSGAGLDVVGTEPIKGDNPLLKARNCIITPHISWASVEARRRLIAAAAENLAAFVRGEPVNLVN